MKRQKAASKRHVLLHETGHSSCQRSFTRRTSPASDARSRPLALGASPAVFNLSHPRAEYSLDEGRCLFLHQRDLRRTSSRSGSPGEIYIAIFPAQPKSSRVRSDFYGIAVRCLFREKFIPLIFMASIRRPAHVSGPFINFLRRFPRT